MTVDKEAVDISACLTSLFKEGEPEMLTIFGENRDFKTK